MNSPGATSGRLVGREEELEAARARLSEERLVTLLGAPGIGKTALARELAHREAPTLFCDLVPARSLGDVLDVLGMAAGIQNLPASPEKKQSELLSALAGRGDAVVVFDNGEHVVESLRPLVALLLEATSVRILLTSRVPLLLRDEHRLEIGPLDLASGVDLFTLRTRASRRGSSVWDDRLLAELVHTLDGIPLAIELAAAQAQTMSLAELKSELVRARIDLASPHHDVPDRHRTMAAAIDGTWRRLTDSARDGLAALAVFRGEFTLEDADGLLGAVGQSRTTMTELSNHSLLFFDGRVEQRRVLEPIREYVRARTGPPSARLLQLHAGHFRVKAMRLRRAIWGPEARRALDAFEGQFFDFVAAHTWLKEAGASEDAAQMACDFAEYIALHGPFSMTLDMLDEPSLACLSAETLARARFCRGRTRILMDDRASALTELSSGQEVAERAGARDLAARCLLWTGLVSYFAYDLELAHETVGRALELTRDLDAPFDRAQVLTYFAMIADCCNHTAAAREAFAEARALVDEHGILLLAPRLTVYDFDRLLRDLPPEAVYARLSDAVALSAELHDRRFLGVCLSTQGVCACKLGDPERGVELLRRSMQTYAETGYVAALRVSQLLLGLALWHQGDLDEAFHTLAELVASGDPSTLPLARVALGGLVAHRGDVASARRLFELATPATEDDGLTRQLRDVLSVFVEVDEAPPANRSTALAVAMAKVDAIERALDSRSGPHGELGIAIPLTRRWLGANRATEMHSLVVDPGGDWFEVDGGERVWLKRRQALRGILRSLLSTNDVRGLSVEELFSGGWPDDRTRGRPAELRVYTAIKQLRAAGLKDVLQRGPAGYWLDCTVTSRQERVSLAARPRTPLSAKFQQRLQRTAVGKHGSAIAHEHPPTKP